MTEHAFEIAIASTGAVYPVASDESITEVLLSKGISLDTACEEGICGTCITRYVDGEINHRDEILMDEERATHLTPCCSRAQNAGGRITLDI
ncbi:2Fe-2S iron-sulfur cluster binding domain-containing protein [Gammaproteobacteria bacterium]|nr:2Fe-2S iron-sulfur cluster binding domain-containing protein [Gammaproteobacteria bacterium]